MWMKIDTLTPQGKKTIRPIFTSSRPGECPEAILVELQ